jgi:hypothetical protein
MRIRFFGLFRFRISFSETYESIWTVDRTPWTGDQPVARPLPKQDSKTQKRGHTSMPRAGFEPTIPVFERSNTVHALNRATAGTGSF